MMEGDFKTWWEEMREDFRIWLQARADLTKIQAYEKIGKVVGVASSFFIIAFLVGFVIIFLLLMIGSWIAQITDSVAIGVSSVAVFMVALFIFLVVKRKTVLQKPITSRVIEALMEDDEEESSSNKPPNE